MYSGNYLMNKYIIYALSVALLLIGSLFFFYQQSWIIISFPKTTTTQTTRNVSSAKPQQVALWIFKQNRWTCETTEIMSSDDLAQTIQFLLNAWLLLLEEEQMIDGQITVQSVARTPTNNEIFISFTQSPLRSQASTYDSCMLIESMLKTLRVNQISVPLIRLLVHHQPLQDDRLNFAAPWPLAGYLNIQ